MTNQQLASLSEEETTTLIKRENHVKTGGKTAVYKPRRKTEEEIILPKPSSWTSSLLAWETINFYHLSFQVCGTFPKNQYEKQTNNKKKPQYGYEDLL